MAMVVLVLSWIIALAAFVCYVLVLVKMFQHGDTTIAVVCLVLLLCFGIGHLIAFVYGWMKAQQWNLMPIMAAWTGCIVLDLLLFGVSFALR
jgi:hypothetical protein